MTDHAAVHPSPCVRSRRGPLANLARAGLAAALASGAALAPPLASADDPAAGTLPGHTRLEIDGGARPGPLKGAVWYPAAPGDDAAATPIGRSVVFEGETARPGAAPAPAPSGRAGRPLVLLSHGSGGNVDGLGWLAASLVRDGAIVAGVDHPGSTSGDSVPRRSVRLHERTGHVDALLDALEDDPTFGPLIDFGDVTLVGFSMGGATALQAAGARLDHAAYLRYCAAFDAGAVDCRWFERGGVDLAALDTAAFEGSGHEPRVARVVAVDPGFGHAMTTPSLAAIDVPVLLVNLGPRDARWPAVDVSAAGSDLAGRIPAARYEEIDAANHFTFLGPCTAEAADILEHEGEEPVCDDPAGVDRTRTHDRIATLIGRFVDGR